MKMYIEIRRIFIDFKTGALLPTLNTKSTDTDGIENDLAKQNNKNNNII